MTRFLCLALVGAGLLLGLLSARPARGQVVPDTPTSVPAATSTAPTLPDPQALLQQMTAAQIRKGTVHAVQIGVIDANGGGTITIEGKADLSWRSTILHIHQTTTIDHPVTGAAPTTTRSTDEAIIVKNRVAERSGSLIWKCRPATQMDRAAFAPPMAAPPGMQFLDVTYRTVGSESMGGTVVWHVQMTAQETLTSGTYPLTADFYIDRVTSLLLRGTARTTIGTEASLQASSSSTADYTKYGQKLSVTLPACGHDRMSRRSALSPGSLLSLTGLPMLLTQALPAS